MSLSSLPKVDGYSEADSWTWSQQPTAHQPSYPSIFDPSVYSSFAPQMQQPSRQPSRHHSIATSRVVSTATSTPPPPRPQVAGSMVKAQPAFKPTWQGFLDTTKDAMTVVEAALQGRLSHISRRPHDKERAEMLTSGTVLVYEENASGIKRWTDAVHWSPSRVMNNCLIYRQLVRALKPEEKKSALNPSCGTKRKRKESNGPVRSKTGEVLENSEDEYENQSFDPSLSGDVDSMNKVYANFAQSLTPDQQRRFCGSLIDSYEFKESGLMKKTISVKYQGTHHHVISYYSLEDVVSGKLKRPFQDPKLADIQPRPELLNGWKVSLEDEESKDMPLVAGYPHHIQPSHVQHHVLGAVTQTVGAQGVIQTHAPLHLTVPEYWHGSQLAHYAPSHHSPQQYAAPHSAGPQYSNSQNTHQYPVQQPSPQAYTPQQHYTHPPSPQPYSSPHLASPQYSAQPAPSSHYAPQAQSARHYSFDHPSAAPAASYPQHGQTSQYQAPQPTSYPMAQTGSFEAHPIPTESSPAGQQPTQIPAPQADQGRRSSAPIALQPFTQPQFPAAPHPHSYYVTDQKFAPEEKYTPGAPPGY
ncbi:camp independent regulatory protein [Stemphylium lycopersici]|uniref:Camp independent regulatory protein n=1 Tax=Stemphylium lycopersici TaxID=183478 RepID=A0A364MWD0_STELY|nr:camp independent regulatory protein [Stemphylium lycopersici]